MEVSAVASRNDILSERRGTSDDLRLNIGVSVSISPSDASWARFSRSRFRLCDLDPDRVLGVFLPAGSEPGVPSFSSIRYMDSSAQASIWMLAHNHCTLHKQQAVIIIIVIKNTHLDGRMVGECLCPIYTHTDGLTTHNASGSICWISGSINNNNNYLSALRLGLPRWASIKKVKINLDFTEATVSEWQWHQLGHMQVCTWLQADNHASTPLLSFLQAECPSCRPTNSVKALKAKSGSIKNK